MRGRIGERQWVFGGGAAVLAVALVVGFVVADDEPRDITAPHACRTTAHGTAPAVGAASVEPGPAAPAADFDGDGHSDVALAAGEGDVENGYVGGSIQVAYGSGAGTGLERCQFLTQNDPGIPGEARDEAMFGLDTVARDFDDDGYTDLAASVFERDGAHVIVMWGSRRGLTHAARVPGTDGSRVPGVREPILEEQLAAGDFDGDGHADLVFGIGSGKGLLKGPFRRDGAPAGTGRVPAPRMPDDLSGEAAYRDLVAGDLNGDGIDDLVSFHDDDTGGEEDWSGLHWAGSYLQGGREGFARPDGTHVPAGATATVGDVDADGYGDLVVSPRGGRSSRSSVTVAYGTENGPGTRITTLDRDSPGVPGKEPRTADNDAVFTSLDTGDVNGDGYADVVAGAPRAEVYAKAGPEEVLLFLGARHGLTGRGARVFDERDVHGVPGRDHAFGQAVGLTDLDGDHRADLVVSAPGDDTSPSSAWLLPGAADGLSTRGVTRLHGSSFADAKGVPSLLMGGTGIAC
ncbi:FG-GAP and VCBS repeat-containing protein [Streptomyces sporangiiformans]|uniref:FG-GAP and VCBS repeat-containing protein n=1 Tax=Streptomyces sporangiiformans TaxID=2315329 RepID=UPI0023E25601|nr:FG-GAP and VCBS repeat-containing protein [Streptomyces sporangiiformans]